MLCAGGCKRDQEPHADRAEPAQEPAAAAAPSESAAPVGSAAHEASPESGPSLSENAAAPARPLGGGLAASAILDLGPAVPMAARDDGVWILQAHDELLRVVAPVRESSPTAAPPIGTPPPSLTRDAAYFISSGKLLRRPLDRASGRPSGPATMLADDAVNGSRTAALAIAAPAGPSRDVVAYLARPSQPDGDRRAKLYVAARGSQPGAALDLSEEGSGASSVALGAFGDRMVAAYLDGRSAMSPLHARPIVAGSPSAPQPAAVALGADVVSFVGGPPESETQIELAEAPEIGAVALVALSRSTTSFGLWSIAMGAEPRMDAKTFWLPYDNGIDPAPVAAATLCRAPFVALARPEDAKPGAAQRIELRRVTKGGELSAEQIAVARASRVDSISMSSRGAAEGAWLAWNADGRAHAMQLSCAAEAPHGHGKNR